MGFLRAFLPAVLQPFNVYMLLVTGNVIWSITPEQSLERAVKLALFLLLGGLVHGSQPERGDRLYLPIWARAWLVSLR